MIGSIVFHVLRRQYVRIVRQVGSGYMVTSGGPEFFSSGLWLRVSSEFSSTRLTREQ